MIVTRYKEQDQKLKRARRVLYQCIYDLKGEMRELIFSLGILEPVPIQEKLPLLTNGKELYYSPDYVLETREEELMREIFHIVLHGLSGHFEEERHLADTELAWAAMDLQVERMSRFLKPGRRDTGAKNPNDRRNPIGMELYYRAVKNPRLRKKVLENGKLVKRDDHSAWRMKPILFSSGNGGSGEWKAALDALLHASGSGTVVGLGSSVEEMLEEALKGIGSKSDASIYTVEKQNGRTMDYQELLKSMRRLGTACEEEDVPDPMYYSYGLELYGDMPLVEPLEEGERPSLDTLVIAVDTSGSCIDQLPHFFRETRKLLTQLRSTTKVSRVWYLECDAEVQREEVYDGGEIERALPGEHSYEGGGGTDFTPVFHRLAEYERRGGRISCLLYYTDGCGIYPEEGVDFPCYFIFSDEYDRFNERLPEWITGVQLN